MVVSPSIGSPQLYPAGNQQGYPIIRLNSTDQLELSFDDLDADVKAYYYTFQLCDEDWTPSTLSEMEYPERVFAGPDRGLPQLVGRAHAIYALSCGVAGSELRADPFRQLSVKGLYGWGYVEAGFCAAIPGGRFADQYPVASSCSRWITIFAQTHQHHYPKLNVQAINPQNPLDQIKVDILQNYRWDNVIRNHQA